MQHLLLMSISHDAAVGHEHDSFDFRNDVGELVRDQDDSDSRLRNTGLNVLP